MNAQAWPETIGRWTEHVGRLTGLPHSMVAALFVLIIGFVSAAVLGRIARQLAVRATRWVASFHPGSMDAPQTERVGRAVKRAVYWLVIVCAMMTATEILGLPVVTAWLSGVATFLPRLAVAILIVALGAVTARIARQLVSSAARSARLPSADRLGRATEIALLVGTALVAIEQLGIEVSFLKATLLIVLGALVAGAALAFGLGGRDLVANILSAHFVNKLYQVGQTVRIDGAEGRISRITETSVILECDEGDVAIPARAFANGPSTLVAKRSAQ